MSDLIVTLKMITHSSRIICIRVQWNNADLSGCAPRVGCWLGGYLETGGGVNI